MSKDSTPPNPVRHPQILVLPQQKINANDDAENNNQIDLSQMDISPPPFIIQHTPLPMPPNNQIPLSQFNPFNQFAMPMPQNTPHPSLDDAWEEISFQERTYLNQLNRQQGNPQGNEPKQEPNLNIDPFSEAGELFELENTSQHHNIIEFNNIEVNKSKHYPSPSKPIKVVFAGGKGGVGRSLISANLALYLSRLGRRDVLLTDLDSAGGNLHTYLGIEPRLPLAGEILRDHLSPYLLPISGYQMKLCKIQAPLTHAVPMEVRQRALDFSIAQNANILVLDMGGLADPLTIDQFLEADYGIVMVHPDPCSIERAYQFIQTSLYRKLLHGADDSAVVSRAILSADQMGQLKSPMHLVEALRGVNLKASETIEHKIKNFTPKILVNRCRTRADKDLGIEMCAALKRKLSINPIAIGAIENDEMAWKALMQRKALMTEYPGATISSDIERIARRLILDEKEVRV
jgi:flagellar biosynthesis protein FlhG